MDVALFKWVGENFGLVAAAFAAITAGFLFFLIWLVQRFMVQQETLIHRFERQQEALSQVFRQEAAEERKECRERHEAAMGEIKELASAVSVLAGEMRGFFTRRSGQQ